MNNDGMLSSFKIRGTNMTKVVHVTAHLGGGAGKAISGLVKCLKEYDPSFDHRIIVLERPEKEQFVKRCIENGIDVTFIDNTLEINHYLIDADIVILNWWHHPKVAELLLKFPPIPVRLVLWSHINGCTYPFLSYEFAAKYKHIMFTCLYSFDNPLWNDKQREQVMEFSSLVYGMGEFDAKKIKCKIDYCIDKRFSIGYVGTLNYSKLSKQFVKICEKIYKRVPNTEFILVGEPDQKLLQDINNSICTKNFKITGYLEDVSDISLTFDVFGYPLNSDNFATTENSILEAMARALPVVAFKQGTEQYIIKDGETGFLATDVEQYVDIIEHLYKNLNERKRIGVNARLHVVKKYSLVDNVGLFHKVCNGVIDDDKQIINFSDVIGYEPYEVFLSSLGIYSEVFLNIINRQRLEDLVNTSLKEWVDSLPDILKGKTKGSVEHFYSHFKNDNVLRRWFEIIQKYK